MAPNRRRPTKKPTGKTAAVKHRAPKEAPAPRELTGRQKEILRVRAMKEAEDMHRTEFIARMKACQEKQDVSIKAYREKCAVERELELKAEAKKNTELEIKTEAPEACGCSTHSPTSPFSSPERCSPRLHMDYTDTDDESE